MAPEDEGAKDHKKVAEGNNEVISSFIVDEEEVKLDDEEDS